MTVMADCPGPLVWFDVGADAAQGSDEPAAILVCAACSYLVITGGVHDPAHVHTPILREGLAA